MQHTIATFEALDTNGKIDLSKKIAAALRSKGHSNITALHVQYVIYIGMGVPGIVMLRPVTVVGLGKRARYKSKTIEVTNVLGALNVEYEIANDATRGGVAGKYIVFESGLFRKAVNELLNK